MRWKTEMLCGSIERTAIKRFGAATSSVTASPCHLSRCASFACKHAPGMFAEAAKVLKGEAFAPYGAAQGAGGQPAK